MQLLFVSLRLGISAIALRKEHRCPNHAISDLVDTDIWHDWYQTTVSSITYIGIPDSIYQYHRCHTAVALCKKHRDHKFCKTWRCMLSMIPICAIADTHTDTCSWCYRYQYPKSKITTPITDLDDMNVRARWNQCLNSIPLPLLDIDDTDTDEIPIPIPMR